MFTYNDAKSVQIQTYYIVFASAFVGTKHLFQFQYSVQKMSDAFCLSTKIVPFFVS